MPIYLYSHPETGEIKEVFQGMNDEHSYEEEGVKFKRIFTVPQASIDTKVDPYSKKDFKEKICNKKGTIGDLWDASAEMSEKRAAKDGKDAIKEKALDNYAKERQGRRHISEVKTEFVI